MYTNFVSQHKSLNDQKLEMTLNTLRLTYFSGVVFSDVSQQIQVWYSVMFLSKLLLSSLGYLEGLGVHLFYLFI